MASSNRNARESHETDFYMAFLTTFGSAEAKSGGMKAGLLITDESGIPLEFIATSEPVQPTALQRTLYGGSLNAYIAHDVCGGKLLEMMGDSSLRPQLVCVRFDGSVQRLQKMWNREHAGTQGVSLWHYNGKSSAGATQVGDSQGPSNFPTEAEALLGNGAELGDVFQRIENAYEQFLKESEVGVASR